MDENRLEGTGRNLGGKVQEGLGKGTGDVRRQAEGIANQAAGAAQDLYGQATDTARETASSFEKALRHTIETPTVYQRSIGARNRVAAWPNASTIVIYHTRGN